MSRRKAPLQINSFSGGLITEANLLNQNPQSSYDELNMELNRDKSRSKRLGFDYEESSGIINSNYSLGSNEQLYTSIFKWENAGGDPDKSLLVAQVGLHLAVYDLDTQPVSSGQIFETNISYSPYAKNFDYSVVDGLLVVCTGKKKPLVLEYNEGSIEVSSQVLYVRDLWGVQSFSNGLDLTVTGNIDFRPPSLEDRHLYNLRNQTYAIPRFGKTSETLQDCIKRFNQSAPDPDGNQVLEWLVSEISGGEGDEGDSWGTDEEEDVIEIDPGYGKFPSNADSCVPFIAPNANRDQNRTIDRYLSQDAVNTDLGTSEAPKGYFIIDALDRGRSRLYREKQLRNKYPELDYAVTDLPLDFTPGGASVSAEFSGRVWFGGFSNELQGGDSKSPRMGSYVLFSRIVKDKTDIGACYQEADPTSHIDPDLADTDGGFIKVDGAYGIVKMESIQGSLFIFAKNGVWKVSGTDDSAFSATNYEVVKISDRGCESGNSVVFANDAIYYWASDSIQAVGQNRYGDWESQNLTAETISTRYGQIPLQQKKVADGYFDTYERKIRWVFNSTSVDNGYSEEFVFHVDQGAFTYNQIPTNNDNLPLVVGVTETNPYAATGQQSVVTANGITVTVGGEVVFTEKEFRAGELKELIYLVVERVSPTVQYSFGNYRDSSFYDWGDTDDPLGYEAYLITAFMTGGEPRSRKQTPYLSVFFKRTESGFDDSLNPINQSSCQLSSQWNWTTSIYSNKWSTPREAYRYRKAYVPSGPSDDYDTGELLINTKNKIRGFGHSLAFKFEAVEGKNLYIYGWSFDLTASSEE